MCATDSVFAYVNAKHEVSLFPQTVHMHVSTKHITETYFCTYKLCLSKYSTLDTHIQDFENFNQVSFIRASTSVSLSKNFRGTFSCLPYAQFRWNWSQFLWWSMEVHMGIVCATHERDPVLIHEASLQTPKDVTFLCIRSRDFLLFSVSTIRTSCATRAGVPSEYYQTLRTKDVFCLLTQN